MNKNKNKTFFIRLATRIINRRGRQGHTRGPLNTKGIPLIKLGVSAMNIGKQNFFEKSFYTSYTKLTEIKLITIGLASPERIRRWAEKTLPNGKVIGQVTNANTLHHKTFKPQKGGLFCERIFGPLKDFECACGKTQKPLSVSSETLKKENLSIPGLATSLPQDPFSFIGTLQKVETAVPNSLINSSLENLKPLAYTESVTKNFSQNENAAKKSNLSKRKYCPICDVEYTWSIIRRYQLGYIDLVSPVTHVWYLKATPSYLSILLDMKKKHLEQIVYCSETMTLENSIRFFSFFNSSSGTSWKSQASNSLKLKGEGVILLGVKDSKKVNDQVWQSHKGILLNKKDPLYFLPPPEGGGGEQGRVRPCIKISWESKIESKRLKWASQLAFAPNLSLANKNSWEVPTLPYFCPPPKGGSINLSLLVKSKKHLKIKKRLLPLQLYRKIIHFLYRWQKQGAGVTRNFRSSQGKKSFLITSPSKNLISNKPAKFFTWFLKIPFAFVSISNKILLDITTKAKDGKTYSPTSKLALTTKKKKFFFKPFFLFRFSCANNLLFWGPPCTKKSFLATPFFLATQKKVKSWLNLNYSKLRLIFILVNFSQQTFTFTLKKKEKELALPSSNLVKQTYTTFAPRMRGDFKKTQKTLSRGSSLHLKFNLKGSFYSNTYKKALFCNSVLFCFGRGGVAIPNKQKGQDRVFAQNVGKNLQSSNRDFFGQRRSDAKQKDESVEIGIHKILKKLPIQCYILSSIERITQKKAILMASQKVWKLLVKKAYYRASLKADKIFNKISSVHSNSTKPKFNNSSVFFRSAINNCIYRYFFEKWGKGPIFHRLINLNHFYGNRFLTFAFAAISNKILFDMKVNPKVQFFVTCLKNNIKKDNRLVSIVNPKKNIKKKKIFVKQPLFTAFAPSDTITITIKEDFKKIEQKSYPLFFSLNPSFMLKNVSTIYNFKKFIIYDRTLCVAKTKAKNSFKIPIWLDNKVRSHIWTKKSVKSSNVATQLKNSLGFKRAKRLIFLAKIHFKNHLNTYISTIFNFNKKSIFLTSPYKVLLSTASNALENVANISLNSIVLSDTTIEVATQLTIEKYVRKILKGTNGIKEILANNLARSIIRNKIIMLKAKNPTFYGVPGSSANWVSQNCCAPKKAMDTTHFPCLCSLLKFKLKAPTPALAPVTLNTLAMLQKKNSLVVKLKKKGNLFFIGAPASNFAFAIISNFIILNMEAKVKGKTLKFMQRGGTLYRNFSGKKTSIYSYATSKDVIPLLLDYPLKGNRRDKELKGIVKMSLSQTSFNNKKNQKGATNPSFLKVLQDLLFFSRLLQISVKKKKNKFCFLFNSIQKVGEKNSMLQKTHVSYTKTKLLPPRNKNRNINRNIKKKFPLRNTWSLLSTKLNSMENQILLKSFFLTQLSATKKKINSKTFSESKKTKLRVSSVQMVNNVYSLSHRYRWEQEVDWTDFLEYISAPINFSDKAIPKYAAHRLNHSLISTNQISCAKVKLNYTTSNNFTDLLGSFLLSNTKKKLNNIGLEKGFSYIYEAPEKNAQATTEFEIKSSSILHKEKSYSSLYPLPLGGDKSKDYKGGSLSLPVDHDLSREKAEALKNIAFSGGGLIQKILTELNLNSKNELNKMDKQNRILLYEFNKQIYKFKMALEKQGFTGQKLAFLKGDIFYSNSDKGIKHAKKRIKELIKLRDLLTRRTKLVRKLFISSKTAQSPSSMILSLLPVLPPDLRPIVKMGNSGSNVKIAASDLNRLYQRVIYRNERLKKFLKDPTTSPSFINVTSESSTELKFTQGLLQEAVDNLIQNNKSGVPAEKDSRGRALKSLSDILKGKQGRFRQYLLGKRVDYSGRSVIIVGPKLKIHQCGIPKEMALELFLPFLLKRILNYNLARTVVGAKSLINNNKPLVWELLTEIMQVCPVLLNRAPTLHRLGIQAFIPKLVDGRAILLHPLVCSAFNADFDGDQMAVHVPITVESRAEAWKLMLSRNNLLSPATGDPISVPSQDMVLGCYYLTTQCVKGTTKKQRGFGFYFKNEKDVLKVYNQQKIDLHANVWIQWNGVLEDAHELEYPLEIRITKHGTWKDITPKSHRNFDQKGILINHYIKTTPGKIHFNDLIKNAINCA